MGDRIEITTHARQPTSFYRISSSGLCFELKTHSAAILGLAKEPGSTCQYWCGFIQGGRVWIKGPQGIKTGQLGNISLSHTQFKKFWVAWDRGIVRIGQDEESDHILYYNNDDIDLNCITFTTHDVRFPATWKFRLPPASLIHLRNKPPYMKLNSGEPEWVSVDDQLPDNAIIGGYEGECLYVIRGAHRGSVTPGKFVPSEGVAYVAWGGAANICTDFEILCGHNYKWVATNDDVIPVNAFVAGHSEANEETLYIGRVNHMNSQVPGKVQPSHKVCYIPFGDREIAFKNYEILTVPELDVYSARENFETNLDLGLHQHILNRHNIPNRVPPGRIYGAPHVVPHGAPPGDPNADLIPDPNEDDNSDEEGDDDNEDDNANDDANFNYVQ